MATTSLQCIKFAEQCMDVAESNPERRKVFIEMAQAWLEIAEILGPLNNNPEGNAPSSEKMQ